MFPSAASYGIERTDSVALCQKSGDRAVLALSKNGPILRLASDAKKTLLWPGTSTFHVKPIGSTNAHQIIMIC